MKKSINKAGKECYEDATLDSEFHCGLFHEVDMKDTGDIQFALHTNLGSLTVLDRMTGFGWRDTETGYRDPLGSFWLASGMIDVRMVGCKTLGEAIEFVKKNANTANPSQCDR